LKSKKLTNVNIVIMTVYTELDQFSMPPHHLIWTGLVLIVVFNVTFKMTQFIEQLKESIAASQHEVDDLTTRFAASQHEVYDLTTRFAASQHEVDDLTTRFAASQHEVDDLTSRLESFPKTQDISTIPNMPNWFQPNESKKFEIGLCVGINTHKAISENITQTFNKDKCCARVWGGTYFKVIQCNNLKKTHGDFCLAHSKKRSVSGCKPFPDPSMTHQWQKLGKYNEPSTWTIICIRCGKGNSSRETLNHNRICHNCVND
jgi:hypothetical protein